MFEAVVLGGAIYVCHADTEGTELPQGNAGCRVAIKTVHHLGEILSVMGRQDNQWRHTHIASGGNSE